MGVMVAAENVPMATEGAVIAGLTATATNRTAACIARCLVGRTHTHAPTCQKRSATGTKTIKY